MGKIEINLFFKAEKTDSEEFGQTQEGVIQ